MTRLTDEQLMAYVDGEPPGATQEVVERIRAGLSAEEQSALEDFRRTRDLVQRAYADDAAESPPASLVAMILDRPADAEDAAFAQSPTANVISIKRAWTQPRSVARLGFAMAASLATLFAALFFWSIPSHRNDIASTLAPGPVAAQSELASVLETRRSGDPVAIGPSSGERDHLMVAGTFRDRNGRICREVEALDGELTPQLAAVACRSAETGAWSVEGVAAIARLTGSDGASYAPAGAPEQEALEALTALLGAQQIMKPDEERELIGRAWR